MFTSFKELEAYVLGCGMKKRIALANAHDEPALSAVVNARRKGVVEGTLVGKKDEIIAMLHEMGESENDYEIVDFDGEELDAGAEDMQADGPVFEITTDPDSFNDEDKALEEKGYTFESAEIEMVPQNYIVMTSEDDVRSMTKLLDMLEDNEDVQNVWHNWQQD